MRLFAGTSGYSYAGWKGSFYPEGLPSAKMLDHYATVFPSVEINATFYRMPTSKMLADWAARVPDGFTFALKAPKRITHIARLKEHEADSAIESFVLAAEALGAHRGPLLFQLPPFFKKDLPRLEHALSLLPAQGLAAFEFRHPSWFDDEVYAALRARDVALCWAETDDECDPLVVTSSFGYVRLRKTKYSRKELGAWAERIAAQPWRSTFVYLKHEDEGRAPKLAQDLSRAYAKHAPR